MLEREDKALNSKDIINKTSEYFTKWDNLKKDISKYNEVVLILGYTGTWKTTLVRFLTEDDLVSKKTKNGQGMKIRKKKSKNPSLDGHEPMSTRGGRYESNTFYPEYKEDKQNGIVYCDCPGFQDTRPLPENIAISLFLKEVASAAKKIKIILAIPYADITAGREGNFPTLMHDFHKFATQAKNVGDGIHIAVTRINNPTNSNPHSPEYLSDAIILEEIIKAKLQDYLNQNSDQAFLKSVIENNRILLLREPLEEGDLNELFLTIHGQDVKIFEEELKDNIKNITSSSYTNSNDFGFCINLNERKILEAIDLAKELKKSIEKKMGCLLNDVEGHYTKLITNSRDIYKTKEILENNLKEWEKLKDYATETESFLNNLLSRAQELGIIIPPDIEKAFKGINFLIALQEISPDKGTSGLDLKCYDLFYEELQKQVKWQQALIKIMEVKLYDPDFIGLFSTNNFQKFRAHGMIVEILKGCSLSFAQEKELESLFEKMTEQYPPEYANGNLIISGSIVQLSQVEQETQKRLNDLKSVQVFASKAVILQDTELTLNGINVSIIAPEWYIFGTNQITLNGKEGESHPKEEAAEGEIPGAKGHNGEPGFPGHSAGNFLGLGETFYNASGLTINANGGKGGHGQKGGKGKKGDSIKTQWSESSAGGTYQDRTVRMSYGVGSVTTEVTEYFQKKGSSFGQTGGNAGQGGAHGKGGNQGVIKIFDFSGKNEQKNVKINSTKGDNGDNGEAGEPGLGGENEKTVRSCKVTTTTRYVSTGAVPPPSPTEYVVWKNQEYLDEGCASKGAEADAYNKEGRQKPASVPIIWHNPLVNYKDKMLVNLANKFQKHQTENFFNKLGQLVRTFNLPTPKRGPVKLNSLLRSKAAAFFASTADSHSLRLISNERFGNAQNEKRKILHAGECLKEGECLYSPNDSAFLVMQNDGNFCLYKGTGLQDNQVPPVWASNTTLIDKSGPYFACMQADGNFCIYKGTGLEDNRGFVWASQTTSTYRSDSFFAMIDDSSETPQFCIYSGLNQQERHEKIWHEPGNFRSPFNGSVSDSYNGYIVFIDELKVYEENFFKYHGKVEFLSLYVNLLERVQLYADNIPTDKSTNQTIVTLNFIYSAILSRINQLNSLDRNLLVVDIKGFIELIKSNIKELQQQQYLEKIDFYKKEYNEHISKQINEAIDFIEGIQTEIKKYTDDIGVRFNELKEEVDKSIKKAEENKEALEKQKKKLEEALAFKMVLGGLNFFSQILSFGGPGLQLAGNFLGSASNIAGSFVPYVEGGGKLPLTEVPKGVTDMLKEYETYSADLKKKALQEIEDRIKVIDDTFAGDAPPSESIEKIKEEQKQIKETIEAIKKVRERGNELDGEGISLLNQTLKKLEEDYKDELRKEKEALKKDIRADEAHQKRTKWVSKTEKALNVLKAGFDIYQAYQGSEDAIDKINTAIDAQAKAINRLNNFNTKMQNYAIDMMCRMDVSINEFQKGIERKSHVALDISQWKMQTILKDIKHELGKETKDYELSVMDDFLHLFEKMNDAIDVLTHVYDRIQDYQDKAQLADYIANINLSQFNAWPVEANALSLTISRNVILEQYSALIAAVKQWAFPFASLFLPQPRSLFFHTNTNADISTNTDIENTAAITIQSVEKISKRLDEYLATERGIDSLIVIGEFNSDNKITTPFYTWSGLDNIAKFRKLLRGEKIVLRADLAKFPFTHNYPAIKCNKVGIKIGYSDEERQQSFKEIVNLFYVTLIHSANSYYAFDNQIYKMSNNPLSISYSFEPKDEKGTPWWQSESYEKLADGYKILSPYTAWTVSIEPAPNQSQEIFEQFNAYDVTKVYIELIGEGSYVNEKKIEPEYKDKLQVDDYYSTLDGRLDSEFMETKETRSHLVNNSRSRRRYSTMFFSNFTSNPQLNSKANKTSKHFQLDTTFSEPNILDDEGFNEKEVKAARINSMRDLNPLEDAEPKKEAYLLQNTLFSENKRTGLLTPLMPSKNSRRLNKILTFLQKQEEELPTPEVALIRACTGARPIKDNGFGTQIEVVKFLITCVEDINFCSKVHGRTALHGAIMYEQIEIAQLLLNNNAKADIKDKYGKTAKDYALEFSNVRIQNLFSQTHLEPVNNI